MRQPPPPPPPEAPKAPALTKPPGLLEFHQADYPPDALAKGEHADVACVIDIDATGAVTRAVVEQGASPEFDASALAAIRQFKFSPAELDGKPAAVRIRYVYHFVLERKLQLVPGAQVDPDAGTIEGEVLEAGKRKPVAGAEVTILGLELAAVTDGEGRFSLTGVPAGTRRVLANTSGFSEGTARVELEKKGRAEITIYLRRAMVGELSATVLGEKPKEAPTRRSLSHEELVNVPGAFNDPIRVIQNLPGLARAPFLSGALLVRGSPPGDTGIYLDGDKIPLLFHFLGGPSVINEQMLDRIDFYPGGYGSYYGRNLTGAIDVASRGGDGGGLHGAASIDLFQSVGYLEAPVTASTRVAVAARRSYIDLLLPFFLPNDPKNGTTLITPIYWDYQARLDHKFDNGDTLYLLAFGSDDKLTVVQKGGRLNTPISVDSHIGFHRLHGGYKHQLGPDLSLTISPAVGWSVQSFATEGAGAGGFAASQSGSIFDLSFGLRSELRWQARPWLQLRGGADLLFDRYAADADIQVGQLVRNLGRPITEEVILHRTQPFAQYGEYLEGEIRLGKLQITPGLRFDEIHWYGHVVTGFDPRIWLRYQFSGDDSIKAYTGLYHQPPSALQVDQQLGNPELVLQRAAQFGVGWEHRFSDLWNASVEVFYNRKGLLVNNVPAEARPDGTIFNPIVANVGIGRAYGLELLVRREITAALYGWLSYTLSKAEVLTRSGQPWRAFNFDQPHILTAVLGYRPSVGWELSSRFRLVSGNPTSEIISTTFDADRGGYVADRGNFGAARSPFFAQLDGRAQYTWTYTLWQLSLYLDVQNITNHKNEEFHVYDYRFRDSGGISGIPILPTLGVQGRF